MTDAELPACVQELRSLVEYYSATERVTAFVVLEQAPFINYYGSINDVPADETAAAEMWQEAVITLIEEDVLGGQKLDVVTQFTYVTNAIVVETEFQNLEEIASVQGVETVFISPVFYPCTTETVVYPETISSGQMTGVPSVWNKDGLGYTGKGMTIAVLDTGLDLDHPSFAADPADPEWTADELAAALETLNLNASELYTTSTGGTLSADALYYSAKVPFTFNYAMGNTNVGHSDGIGDHGTHVAGIAAANNVEGSGVCGMAPDAQIIVMKVFNSTTGGANMYDILNALEDAMSLDCDVANLSLGSAAGFTKSGASVIDDIFAKISETGLIVDIAAGNEGTSSYASLWGNGMNTTENIENATISSPSTYVNAMSVASIDNAEVPSVYFTLADGTNVFYMQSVEYLYGYIDFSLEILADQGEVEYVIVPELGEEQDFYDADGNSIADGKVAVVKRGTISFADKAANAAAAGAIGVLIWDNVSEDIFSFGMQTSTTDEDGNTVYLDVPVVLISLEDGQKMADAENKTMTVSADVANRVDPAGGQVSSFSSWGVSPDLRLLPDIAGVGGNVYSCYDGGVYGLMSGTSMATPQVAGVTALVLQYIEEKGLASDDAARRTLVDSLMMSTAVPVIDQDTNLEASPRQQGAGLVNALYAVTSEAYLTVEGSERPKAELKDSEAGSYSFTFTVHNFSSADKTYALSSSLLCEDYATDEYYADVYFMAGVEHQLDSSAVSFSADSVTVPAGGSASVTVTINLTDADKNWIDTYFANGNYVEGYVYLTNADENGVDLSLPFLGFYGDWTDAPIFDTGYWYQNGFWGAPTASVEANEYYHVPFTSLGSSDNDWVLGFNPYTGLEMDANGNVIYDSANNVISPNGDGLVDQISDYYLSLMRNAKWVNLTYTDADGNVLNEEKLDYISKTMYNSNYGSTIPFVYSWYYEGLYDFTDANGEYLADGTELTLTISGTLDYYEDGSDVVTDTIVIPISIDTAAPVLVSTEESTEETEDGNINYLTLTFTEAHPALVALMNNTGSQVYGRYGESSFVENEDGSYSVKMDVTGLGDHFTVALCDYGCNEAYYELKYDTENFPEVDETALYAYSVYNELYYYYYGWDYMFGWSTIDKETAETQMLLSDAYEYYALTAAEYAGGYVFAVDAGYNFLYMVPGLWSRNQICNLGINVIDMAFDETTQTMYLAAKTAISDNDEEYALYTVDLLTGELTLLREYSSYYSMPWAMTFVDGELYACRFYYNGFYKVDLEGGTYDLTAVTDADGNAFVPTLTTGAKVNPRYAQSMTYSKADGVIYWAYYGNNGYELIIIDPAAWTYKAVPFQWDQEFVGVLTVEDDGYTLPESTEVTKLVLSDEQLIMAIGEQAVVTASTLPWNAPAGEVTWTSADENIAAVENGVITAVSEGSTVITASHGDLTAQCSVHVVNITGNVYAYDYYSGDGYGYWQDITLNSMTAVDLYASPVDFIAADYNGHDGKIYGFDLSGQCYSYDPETQECVALGASSGLSIADMAYDYSSGLMYAAVYDYMTWSTNIYYVNMNTGALVEAAVAYDIYFTLACSTDGVLYAINYYGELYELSLVEGDGMSGGIGWAALSTDSTTVLSVASTYIMQTPAGSLNYAQSMCYDHENDVILWASPEYANFYWLNVADDPYAIALGDPSGSGVMEYVGLYVVPAEIEPLPYVAVENVEAEDMMVLVGGSKIPQVSVYPLNSTNQVITYTSADESIVKIEDGMIVGVGVGNADVTAELVDTDTEGNETTYTVTFTVRVKASTDNIYGYLMQDIVTYNGYSWINIPDTNPANYADISYIYNNGTYMTLYSAEYVDGYIYAYGYDDQDWNATFQYMTIDAKTWSVIDSIDMGHEFPFVYDMAFDYTTGTMYALAGSSTATDLYMVNMETGKLVECLLTEPMFMSLAIDGDGTIYAMENSKEEFDWFTWTSTYSNAILYTIDVENGTYEPLMDTGVGSNMLASMAYDYDTGYLYWTGLLSSTSYVSGLYLIDLEDMSCNNLGTIGSGGSQVNSLMIFADEYPEIPDTLQNVAITESIVDVAVDATVELEMFVQPAGLEYEAEWTSADETIATVDENGVVTGVSAGVTTITVTVTDGETTVTASCTVVVYGEEDYFLTYNWTDGGFSSIGRPDSTKVSNLTEGEEEPEVRSMVMVDGVVYAYDVENNLFTASEEDGSARNYIGNANIEVPEDSLIEGSRYNYYFEYYFVVRDMAWDAANERMLALGALGAYKTTYNDSYSYVEDLELDGGCRLYEVNMETGDLTELCTIGSGDTDESGVYMFEITETGDAYVYSTFMDYVSKLDTETGEVTSISTLQNQGVYGSSDGEPMAMTYDALTGNIYMLFTTNGNYYMLYKFNVGTGALSLVGNVGEVEYYSGDAFAGLAVHHNYTAVETAPTCTEDGQIVYTCHCGESYTVVLEALGHNYELTEKVEATCTEDGHETYTCENCKDAYNVVLEATGHSYGDWVEDVAPGCESDGQKSRTCANCGHIETMGIESTGHSFSTVVTEATETENGYTTYTCVHCGFSFVMEHSSTSAEGADTGDSFNFGGWMMLMAVSAAAAAVLVTFKRREQE